MAAGRWCGTAVYNGSDLLVNTVQSYHNVCCGQWCFLGGGGANITEGS